MGPHHSIVALLLCVALAGHCVDSEEAPPENLDASELENLLESLGSVTPPYSEEDAGESIGGSGTSKSGVGRCLDRGSKDYCDRLLESDATCSLNLTQRLCKGSCNLLCGEAVEADAAPRDEEHSAPVKRALDEGEGYDYDADYDYEGDSDDEYNDDDDDEYDEDDDEDVDMNKRSPDEDNNDVYEDDDDYYDDGDDEDDDDDMDEYDDEDDEYAEDEDFYSRRKRADYDDDDDFEEYILREVNNIRNIANRILEEL